MLGECKIDEAVLRPRRKTASTCIHARKRQERRLALKKSYISAFRLCPYIENIENADTGCKYGGNKFAFFWFFAAILVL